MCVYALAIIFTPQSPTPNSLISVGYHLEVHVAITFYRHYCFLPTKLYHVLRCTYYLLVLFGFENNTPSKMLQRFVTPNDNPH